MQIHSFLKFFALLLDLGGYLSQKGEMAGVCMFQGQIGKIASQSPGKSDSFPLLALFCHWSLPKIWPAHPH